MIEARPWSQVLIEARPIFSLLYCLRWRIIDFNGMRTAARQAEENEMERNVTESFTAVEWTAAIAAVRPFHNPADRAELAACASRNGSAAMRIIGYQLGFSPYEYGEMARSIRAVAN